MGLFGLIKRSKPAPRAAVTPIRHELPAPVETAELVESPVAAPEPAVHPDALRQMLFDAIATGDESRLARLCREHRAFIREYAANWMIVPNSLHANPAAAEWYTRGLKQLTRLGTAGE